MEKKITKQDLRLGNMFKEGVVCKINGRTGAKVHVYGKARYDSKGHKIKVIHQVSPAELTPILITEDVLINWMDSERLGEVSTHIGYKIGDLVIMLWSDCVCVDLGQYEPQIHYLHELQNLYYVLNGKELPIKELQNLVTIPADKK